MADRFRCLQTPRMTRGEEAERQVEQRLRKALPEPDYRIYVNVN